MAAGHLKNIRGFTVRSLKLSAGSGNQTEAAFHGVLAPAAGSSSSRINESLMKPNYREPPPLPRHTDDCDFEKTSLRTRRLETKWEMHL